MSDNLSFKDLSSQAQEKAINEFVPFYIGLLRNKELDVMTIFDMNHVMADINRTINTASNKIPEDLYEYVINFNNDDYHTLMSELPQTYFDNGNPTTDWSEWYVSETNKLDPNATL
ncbi:hypothetical protein BGL34_03040 [Fructilactobacillus lindneri]|uniref:Uncharacterized protein n=2 Tax=Fructilactobacillus lindneri TaxID=53444 RepID=A0A0R2JTD7_9LACO|nr:hypothetical protein [Fructilactobacillus lindneri]ANZ57890.1 hypothetical protein AYR60_03490 [Fructilactobacillus lindneri]ANZ59159.1 hypothetical protein AYR59_03490 [Fructilactobacillus lindneri]KRN78645.1 hypothetical protein IV52_GL000921 [Fructilactobacillus lindneri DSM 20690 = JCM 11027]POG98209.1 hypothetical protein BGL31_03820 [Fructilactobacillus lindneri]POH01674.1 hypothetical protein BGL32_03610 [Fructilactobacillus lindneri]